MKNILKMMTLTAALVCAYNVAIAQSARNIRVGARGGLVLATARVEEKVNGDWDSETQEYITGSTGGLVFEFKLSNNLAIQPEVNFIQKGYKIETTFEDVKVTTKTYLNYAEVPVFAKVNFMSGPVNLNVLAGPSFGYAVVGTIEIKGEKDDVDFDEMNRFEAGLVLGFGASVDAGPGALFLDARYGWGLTDLINSDLSNRFHWHNRGYNFGIGYLLHIGK